MAPTPASRHRLGPLAWLSVAALTGLTGYLFLARWFWPAEILCHFRPHLGALGLLAAAVAMALRLRAQSLALGALALVSAWPTLALCVPNGAAARPPGLALRVATANLLWGSESFDALERWLEEEDPAVVFVCEIDAASRDRPEGLRARYPHQFLAPPREEWHAATWGRALISRLPLVEPAARWPGPILDARVPFDSRMLRVLGAHPVRPGGPR